MRINLNELKKKVNRLSTGTKAIFDQYNQDKTNGTDRPFDNMLYNLFKLWRIKKVLLYLSIGLLALAFIKTFFAPIVATLFLIGCIYAYLDKPPRIVNPVHRYQFIQCFIYDAFINMKIYLPIQYPQSIHDISRLPRYLNDGDYYVYTYQLIKTTPEKVDDEKISFAKKILQHNINHKCDIYEHLHNNGTTFFNDMRVIQIDDIIDHGTHYIVSIIYVDNEYAYTYIKNKSKPMTQSEAIDSSDEDF